jgi:hypothetical protein
MPRASILRTGATPLASLVSLEGQWERQPSLQTMEEKPEKELAFAPDGMLQNIALHELALMGFAA